MATKSVKKTKSFGVVVFIGSLLSGVFLGIGLSLVVTFINWYQVGFNVANQRLVTMTSQDITLIAPFNDTTFYQIGNWVISKTQSLSSKIEQNVPSPPDSSPEKDNMLKPMFSSFSKFSITFQEIWLLTANTFLMIFSKLSLIVLGLPFLVLCFLIGVVDGLSRRAIRIAEYAREQGSFLIRCMSPLRYLISGSIAAYFAFALVGSPILYFVVSSLLIICLTSLLTSLLPKNL